MKHVVETKTAEDLELLIQWLTANQGGVKKVTVEFKTPQGFQSFCDFAKDERERRDKWTRTWVGLGNPDPDEPDFGYEDLRR